MSAPHAAGEQSDGGIYRIQSGTHTQKVAYLNLEGRMHGVGFTVSKRTDVAKNGTVTTTITANTNTTSSHSSR